MSRTPGPWEAEHKWDRAATQHDDPGYYVIESPMVGRTGVVADTLNRDCVIDPDEDRANAHLIAAAPDLQHACLAALGFLGGVSILTKEQLQTLLADACKKSGVNKKWSSG